MPLILDLAYFFFLLLVSPIILYRSIRYGKYREGWGAKFFGCVPALDPKKEGKRIWFQAVSVGEVNLLKPILKELETRHPDWEAVISTTSKTGFQLAKKLFPNRTVFYCPLDFSGSVRRAFRRIKPDALALIELELWPNLILAANRYRVPIAILNGRISDGSFRNYRRFRGLFRSIFRKIDLIAASDSQAANYFAELGMNPDQMIVTGSIKFDGVQTDRANPKTQELANLAGITPEEIVFLAGSTQSPEEEYALAAYRQLAENSPELRLILVPRHPERFDAAAQILDDSGIPWTRRSAISSPLTSDDPKGRVLLVDTVGELGAWWGTASIAFVGGSMGKRGGQNMLEPAAYGAAVSFGPNTKNFRDISEAMIRSDAAVVVKNGEEMAAFVRRALEDPLWRNQLGENASALVLSGRGACRKTIDRLEALILGLHGEKDS